MKKIIFASAVALLFSLSAMSQSTNVNTDKKEDLKDLRKDKNDIRSDKRERHHERKEGDRAAVKDLNKDIVRWNLKKFTYHSSSTNTFTFSELMPPSNPAYPSHSYCGAGECHA